jgi:hypothetical protein
MSSPRRFWGWPGARLLAIFAVLYLAVSVLFAAVYVGADARTRALARRVRVDLPFERAIPFVPAMAWVYMSIYVPFLLAPFVLRSRRELQALALSASAVILVAGVGFILIPAELGYEPPSGLGPPLTMAVFHFADRLNLDYNLVPSLHVALSATCAAALATRAAPAGRRLLLAWALAVGASTLLTHQHHVVDVVSGYLVAGAAFRWIYRPLASRELGAAS